MKTLLVVDDHPIVLAGLHALLRANGYATVEARTLQEAADAIAGHQEIDLLLCDLTIQQCNDGLQFVEKLRIGGFNRPCVIYTMHEELCNVAAIAKADVEGVVLKGDDIDELLTAVNIVINRGKYQSPSFRTHAETAKGFTGLLSTVDLDVLQRVAHGENCDKSPPLYISLQNPLNITGAGSSPNLGHVIWLKP